jgi:predicted amidohydrolase YtcJ
MPTAKRFRHWPLTALLAAMGSHAAGSPPEPADVVLTDGRIFTVDSRHSSAEALAVRDDRIVFVGSNTQAQQWVGPSTQVLHLGGHLVLPGLIDAHIHALDTLDLDVCDLDSRKVTLRQMSKFVSDCIARYQPAEGSRLIVHQWDYVGGNQTDAQFPTLRAALDAASTKVEIEVLGNDAHHAAFNSLGLAHARNAAGQVLGLSKATLAGEFSEYQDFVGVDSRGEPNGAVNEDARYLINPTSMVYTELAEVLKAPQRVPQRLNSVGITGFMDAMASPLGQPVYDKLLADGTLTARVQLAQFYDPSRTRNADGSIDYDGIVKRAIALRAKYANNSLLHADFIKVFADGVMEANPLAKPPTLGNAAVLKAYRQPLFALDKDGKPYVKSYVDTDSKVCQEVRANLQRYLAANATAAFEKAHGYFPAQCAVSYGHLQHERPVILEYVKRVHLAGFNLHIHVIGDRALRTALDAIEAARLADGITTTHDSLAHIQIADPSDVARVGRDHLYVTFTYSWMDTLPDYDVTVIPFLDKVSGNSYATLHPPGNFYDAHAYPVKSVQQAGAILAAGSDAPVGTRDPQPFVNMATAVTRAIGGEPPLSPAQSISIRDAIEAYTLGGARMLKLDGVAGSIEVGKSADFIEVDQDILALADANRAADIANTHVLGTWFQGRRVYTANH